MTKGSLTPKSPDMLVCRDAERYTEPLKYFPYQYTHMVLTAILLIDIRQCAANKSRCRSRIDRYLVENVHS